MVSHSILYLKENNKAKESAWRCGLVGYDFQVLVPQHWLVQRRGEHSRLLGWSSLHDSYSIDGNFMDFARAKLTAESKYLSVVCLYTHSDTAKHNISNTP